MRSNHVTAAALLALAGTGIVHVVLSERRHRDRTLLETARMHQQLLAAQVERPSLRAIWGSLAPLDSAERRLHLHRNAWVAAWEVMYRVGALNPAGVDGAARALFATPEGMQWWTRVREGRARAAVDERARQFHSLMDTAFQDETGKVLPSIPTATDPGGLEHPQTSRSR
ncbi:DUF6082 family protein [Streptomyces roseochromogenus]|uniref:Secreted protein n=1 Tax=Streptomyces roseochromogenus subsp. oscitans DS 12.976 TaxID=1352936 RepID=V6K5F1_STRRC|nr:DUF6082 family protein [Streptomyces roseochromogenus]EST27420.1 hypothetical protein M878_25825 [Streptomyces roseochromogenus subsp. oscitans DS 12.976]